MPLSTLFRTSLAFRLSPLFVLAMFGGFQEEPGWPEPYGLAATAYAEGAMWVLAPLTAMCAAWEGHRLRRADWLEQPRRRSLVSVAAWAIAPVMVVSWVTFLIGVAVEVLPLRPDLRVTGLGLLLLLAWTVLGFGVGLVTHAIVSLPTMMVAGFCWFSLPAAYEPVWMRHLTGDLLDCCSVKTDVSRAVLVAAGTVAVGIALSGAALIRSRLPQRAATWRALAPVPFLATVVIATPLIDGLGPMPVVAREVAMACKGSEPTICVYPERDEGLSDLRAITTDAYRAWARYGFEGPSRLSETAPAFHGAVPLHTYTGWDRQRLTTAVVEATVPWRFRTCDTERSAARRASRDLSAWLALGAGIDRGDLPDTFGRRPAEHAVEVSGLPDRRQRRWVARQLMALGTCQPDGSGDLDGR